MASGSYERDALSMVVLVDTHVHLSDPQFPRPEMVVRHAVEAGIHQMIAVGTDRQSSRRCVELAETFPQVYAAVGIHPNSCHEATPQDWQDIVELVHHPRVVAVGETGMDKYWDFTPLAKQQDFFERHIELAKQCGKPLIIHMRDCQEEILVVLEKAGREEPLHGVMHSYSGSLATAHSCLRLGLHISFSGMLTYKKSDQLRNIAAALPFERLLVETDAPYLSPEPHRGQRPNEPALLVHTVACLAQVRKTSVETMAELTTANARRLFHLPSQ